MFVVGVVVQNPDPQVVLQWEDGEESGLLLPTDLIQPTDQEITKFKQSAGYQRYLQTAKKATGEMKQDVYFGPGKIAKFQQNGKWRIGQIINDPKRGLIGEELQFHEMYEGTPRQVITSEVQLLP